ncbi:MAG: hypothetical protein WHV66_02615 [Anaerolineales bacterium]|jgi:hypothetical protein
MSRDLRQYARQTTVRLIAGGLILLILVGDGLIYLIYGPGAAISGLICIGIGLIPPILVIGVLALLDWVTRRARSE